MSNWYDSLGGKRNIHNMQHYINTFKLNFEIHLDTYVHQSTQRMSKLPIFFFLKVVINNQVKLSVQVTIMCTS